MVKTAIPSSSMDIEGWNTVEDLRKLFVPPHVDWNWVKGQISVGPEPIKKAHPDNGADTENPWRLINS